MKNHKKILNMVYIALFAVVIAICSWISIPSAIPFTLQTFAIFSTLILLGGKKGTITILIYILIGAIGVPVFAGFNAGLGYLVGSTGGYIFGFLLIGLTYWGFIKAFGNKLLIIVIALIAGTLLCYSFGTAWFIYIYARDVGTIGVTTALLWCVIPFIIPDALKMLFAVILSRRLKKEITIDK